METVLINYIDDLSFNELVGATLKGDSINILLDSYGGSLVSGWKMYDAIKNYEGEVFVNVIGSCMSASNLVLLAVDKVHRCCNEHAEFLIHKPLLDWFGALTQKDIKEIDKLINVEQSKLMKLYNSELTASTSILNALVENEQVFDAKQAMAYGFVGSINVRKTDDSVKNCISAVRKMQNNAKSKIDMDKKMSLINQLVHLLKNEKEVTVTDANGNEVKVSCAGDTPSVGDAIEAEDGAILMADGSTYIVEDGVIKEIVQASTEEEKPTEEPVNEDGDKDKQIEELEAKVKALEEEKEKCANEAEEEKKEKEEELQNLKNENENLKAIVNVINELGGVDALKNIVSKTPSVKNDAKVSKSWEEMNKEERRAYVRGK